MTANTNNRTQTEAITAKIDEIGRTLLKLTVDGEPTPRGIGLLSGLTGKLLFLYQWQKLMPESSRPAGSDLDSMKSMPDNARPDGSQPASSRLEGVKRKLGELTDTIRRGYGGQTYCNGVAGVLHGLRIIDKLSPGSVEGLALLETAYKPLQLTYIYKEILAHNYDYLHGAIGVANLHTDDEQFASITLKALEQSGERDGDRIRWKSQLALGQGVGYNICLSHGISSLVAYLARVARTNPSESVRQEALKMLREATNYILTQKIDFGRHGSFFPSTSLDNGSDEACRSRMAWCYGDPGVLAVLWQAAVVLDDSALRSKVHDMMLRTGTRRMKADTMIADAGICHGSAGLTMLFHYYADQTGDPAFRETADFWTRYTMDFAGFDDGLAGFKSRNYDKQKGYYWENNSNLLEGIAGIGLALMLSISDDKELRANIYDTFNLYRYDR